MGNLERRRQSLQLSRDFNVCSNVFAKCVAHILFSHKPKPPKVSLALL